MSLIRAFGRAVGPSLVGVGSALETLGMSLGEKLGTPLTKIPPAYVGYREMEESVEVDAQLWVKRKAEEVIPVPKSFVAPTADLADSVNVEDGASVWYNAKVKGSVSLGLNSAILDGTVLSGTKETPIVLGANVMVGPLASVAEGVQIGDGSKIGAGAKIESKVKIAQDAVVGEGAVVPANTEIKSRELWAGAPATMIRMLEPVEIKENAEKAAEIARIGILHQKEHQKDLATVHAERQAFKDRLLWSEDLMEDDPSWSVFAGVDAEPVIHKERPGLLYDK